jgi:hypothetical protein
MAVALLMCKCAFNISLAFPFSIDTDQDRHNKIRHLRDAVQATFAALFCLWQGG